MRIKHIRASQLFGIFNHSIPLNLDERITIIHGPNGFGKTVLLKTLHGLFNRDYQIFHKIPFESFQVDFEDGTGLTVSKKVASDKERTNSPVEEICIEPSEHSRSASPYTLSSIDFRRFTRDLSLSVVEEIIPQLTRVGRQEWMDLTTATVLSLTEVMEKYGNQLPLRHRSKSLPQWLEAALKGINVHFINTERLVQLETREGREQGPFHIRDEYPRPIQVVDVYSRNLADLIQATLAKSVALSQSLDQTFPMRLVSRSTSPGLTKRELDERLTELEEKRQRLRSVGLLDKDETQFQSPPDPDDMERKVLSIYVEDVHKKLSVFDELATKIDLLTKIINSRFEYKHLEITKDGFRCFAADGQEVHLSALSSGERHEIVLIYNLLFNVREGTLILIDEPELSLHIVWQQQFLKDLQQIIQISPFDVLIATHSPNIIHNRWDLTVQLSGDAQ